MALKTFNVSSEVYEKFSEHCKREGLSMSKKIDNFMKSELERLSGTKKPKRMIRKVQQKKEHSFSKYC